MDKRLATLIESLEVELLKPEVRRSSGRLSELLAEGFFEFGVSGNRYSRNDVLELLPQIEAPRYEINEFQILELSVSTVLATYRIEMETLSSQERVKSLRSSIWQQINGTWQMIFHQGTPLRG